MKVIDFLNIKDDAWGIMYFNSIGKQYVPSLQDNIVKIKFLKNDESGKYNIYTDSNKDIIIDCLTIDEVKKYCTQVIDCRECVIKEFCTKSFNLIPRKW